MIFLKIVIGLLALLIAWAYIFQKKMIFQINAWMRANVFSDHVALFSGRRVAALLIVLGCIALFSGLQSVIQIQPIKPNIAATMMNQAHQDFKDKKYTQAINRCRELIRSNPNSVEAWELLVTTWWVLGEKAKARQAAESLLRLDPDHPFGKNSFQAEMEKIKRQQQ